MGMYRKFFDAIKADHPESYQNIIQVYLDLIIEFYKTNKGLATVEILDMFQKFKNDPDTRKEYEDVYNEYGRTNFLTRTLQQKDIEIIKKRYFEGLSKLGKEYDCVIQP